MTMKLIADSCCDMTPQLRDELELTSVPLTLRVDEKEFIDDQSLDQAEFMQSMKASPNPARSAAPSPAAYLESFRHDGPSFAITLSSKLSQSYASAELAKSMAAEEGYEDVHIFDSQSAAAGETLVALKAKEYIDEGNDFKTIVERVEEFISNMKTYFVLEDYSNLEKNGRLNKVTGRLISVLNIKLVMGSDGEGNISLYKKARGIPQAMNKLIGLVESSGKKTKGEKLVISHVNNLSQASDLARRIREKFQFKDIVVVPAGGLTSLYAYDKGIVLAF